MKTLLAIALTATVLLAGCGEDKKTEAQPVVQTADWYLQHEPERKAMVEKCKANPVELADDLNCKNAKSADASAPWSKRGGIKVKPLTAEELGYGKKN
jgi:hypothetical protein